MVTRGELQNEQTCTRSDARFLRGQSGFGLFAQNTNSSNGKAPPTELTFRVDLRRLVPTTLTIEEGKYRILISSGFTLCL